ncbi:hypothetical protein MXB_3797 [Myxobolus squamalis]|nr:hypothetical protein MXB_3797 [Myxobolus squamalis]
MAVKHFESDNIHETLNIEEMKFNFKSQTNVSFVTDKVAIMNVISSTEKYPNLNYFNNLYIYPKNLNFSRATNNYKNLQMTFYLLDQEPSDVEAYINDHLNDNEKSTLISYSDK